ncbi:hypothetical protein RND71_039728 [Anisodus tanguticus]|uniref:Uncharacterized protein n=1 Tax=Anisodus tanguticus TaxID=243964 RepID=A0AAE1US94_9SOLA|nr:hypothetical protein RND71_039728 [Anisodus tanguticus]
MFVLTLENGGKKANFAAIYDVTPLIHYTMATCLTENISLNNNLSQFDGPYLSLRIFMEPFDSQRAIKCYKRDLALNPDNSTAGEAICDFLDASGKESLEIAVCREASDKSPRAFWALCRLGYLLVIILLILIFYLYLYIAFLFRVHTFGWLLRVNQKKWSEAMQSLQQAIRGYPTCADLWEEGHSYKQSYEPDGANRVTRSGKSQMKDGISETVPKRSSTLRKTR